MMLSNEWRSGFDVACRTIYFTGDAGIAFFIAVICFISKHGRQESKNSGLSRIRMNYPVIYHSMNLTGQNYTLLFKAGLQSPDINLSQIHATAYRLCRRDSRGFS
jgi:hypothetical protein